MEFSKQSIVTHAPEVVNCDCEYLELISVPVRLAARTVHWIYVWNSGPVLGVPLPTHADVLLVNINKRFGLCCFMAQLSPGVVVGKNLRAEKTFHFPTHKFRKIDPLHHLRPWP